MSLKRLLTLSIILLLLGWIVLYFLPEKRSQRTFTQSSEILQILPERLRGFIAARLWEKADHLMHKGPVVAGQSFVAGSYAGNTDIIAYLKLVIALCPEETAPYRLLASNYAYHLGMKKEAIKLIEAAISNCMKSKYLHELYASAAFILLFAESKDSNNRNDELEKAAAYIDKAINSFSGLGNIPDPVFTLKNYYIIESRIFWELGKPEQAVEAWQKNGENNLEDSSDRLAKVLLKYRQTGIYESLNLGEQKFSIDGLSSANVDNIQKHNHEHEDSHQESNSGHEKSLLQALIWLSLKAGLLCLIVILWYFLGSKSCGTVSYVFQFSAGK